MIPDIRMEPVTADCGLGSWAPVLLQTAALWVSLWLRKAKPAQLSDPVVLGVEVCVRVQAGNKDDSCLEMNLLDLFAF